MTRRDETPRDLLFGLLALQNGLIDQEQLIGAFSGWSRAKGRTLAEILVDRGAIDAESHALLAGMAAKQLKLHGGDTEKSLAALPAGPSTRARLTDLGDSDLNGSLLLVGTMTEDDDPYKTAVQVIGTETSAVQRFRILRPHAKGGLGAVYVAHDRELNREVALKEILDRHAENLESRARFQVEAEITGGLEHPGIVPVYGSGQYEDGRPYYAMRFIRGDTLKEAIDDFHLDEPLKRGTGKRSLDLRKLLRRFVDVCNAIDYAHGRGILHRDLKPGNVIVGKHGETLVVDWGLAKPMGQSEAGSRTGERTLMPSSASGSAETLPGAALGTPAYMSPEQARGDLAGLGPRSDVYSLGVTLYSLLTGKPPFEGGDLGTLLHNVQEGRFPPPRQLDPSIDRALEAVCLKAMAKNSDARHASARALADDIERWAADEPTLAWTEPFSARARRWMRRNRTTVTAASVAFLALLFGTWAVLAVETRANAGLKKSNQALNIANAKEAKANRETRAALEDTRKAQKETVAALGQSEESRKQAEAVGKFLVDAFKKPDPLTEGKDVKVADILDQALAEIQKGFAGSKATEGALLDALGQSYKGLGLYPKAEDAHRKALVVREAALGPNHRDTLVSNDNLAVDYALDGRYSESISIHQSTLKRREATLGPDHPETLNSRNNIAAAYRLAGRVDEAIPIYEATLKQQESKLGPDHPDTLTSRGNLANAYQAAGRVAEAITICEATLRRREAVLGPDHPDTLLSRGNLAEAYRCAGRVAEAILLFEATLKQRDAKLGPGHPDTLTTRNNLAVTYVSAGRFAEAIPILESTLKLQESNLGADHPDTLRSRHNLAGAYQLSGRIADAIPMFEATLKQRESKIGPNHPDTLITRNNLADAYSAAGRNDEAIPVIESTLKMCELKLGPDHPETLNTLHHLANAYRSAGAYAEAFPIYESTLKLYESSLGTDHPNTLNCRNNLAVGYWSAGRFSEAIATYELALKMFESKLGPDHPNTLTCRNNLVSGYDFLHRWAAAEFLYRDTLVRRREKEKPDSPLLTGDLATLSRNLLKQSKWSEAEALARECLTIRVQTIPDDYRRFNAASLLGEALLGQDKYAEGEPLVVAGYEGMKAREAKIPTNGKIYLSEAGERVVQLYRAWGKPNLAAEWAAKLGLAELPTDVFAR